MLLVFDIGNSETTIAVFAAERLRAQFRLTTAAARTSDEFGVTLRALLESANIPLRQLDGAAMCSVVPPVSPLLAEACRRVSGRDPVVIDAQAVVDGRLPVTLPVDEPLTVGADRVANALAALELLQQDAIVVDIGTATTFDCITSEGAFFGGVIQPGVRTSAASLFRDTSQLPPVAISAPGSVIAKNTEDCIRAGVVYGAVDSIDGIVRRLKAEWPRPATPLVVATGGLAEFLAPYCKEIDRVEPFFTLHGLRIGYEILTGGGREGAARGEGK